MDSHVRDTVRQELERLRAAGARRQDLSHHACRRLFFDLGIRPSVTAVRDLTQVGSATDIPRDIDAFWETVRSSVRVRVEAGGIPQALQERAGELLAELFAEARVHAETALEGKRAEAYENVGRAEASAREAEIRLQTVEQARQRAEARAEEAAVRIASLEAELNRLRISDTASQAELRDAIAQSKADNAALTERLATEQSQAARLRGRIEELQDELRRNTERYAQQINDAVKDAERRVKPMLVELDGLRGVAATYQANIREAGRKEFEFIQQLSVARSRADRLESQVRAQSDEIDALTRERDAHRVRAGMSAEAGKLIASLAADGRLTEGEIAALGAQADPYVSVPPACPACEDGEPELQLHEDEYELSCPKCERTSGAATSKLAALYSFRHTSRVRA
ncbi:DNA-binding protein [Burkholderia sp. 8Y]|uniref:DNA-binding protein n=1 Tax=Burkholderia sp. 8Y TaxID=2653133 RepID=UPI0012F46075|nr:DNA-binding protein [Burkholderia sp. 8Y]VXC88693.1 DNA-binding protein [Burkholderia sp. 8Y]